MSDQRAISPTGSALKRPVHCIVVLPDVTGLLHGREFFHKRDHAVKVTDALGHNQVLAVDNVSGNALDLRDVIGDLPAVGQGRHGSILFRGFVVGGENETAVCFL